MPVPPRTTAHPTLVRLSSCSARSPRPFPHGFLSPDQRFVLVRNPLITDANLLGVRSVAQMGNGVVRLQGVGVPNAVHTVRLSPTLTSGFSVLGTTTADVAGLWQFDDANAPGQLSRFYEVSFP